MENGKSSPEGDIVLSVKGLEKTFAEGPNNSLSVLKGVDLEVRRGESIAVIGSSGSGKSTFLQCIGGLDDFSGGDVVIGGRDLKGLSDKEKTLLRNRDLGFVYQFHHLLAEFTALENVAFPLRIRKTPSSVIEPKALGVLEILGLKDRSGHFPGELSGGERQRVAIARAVIGDPLCLLADEPTGNLDHETASEVADYLLDLCRRRGLSMVIVTHDSEVAARCDRILRLKDGKLFEESDRRPL